MVAMESGLAILDNLSNALLGEFAIKLVSSNRSSVTSQLLFKLLQSALRFLTGVELLLNRWRLFRCVSFSIIGDDLRSDRD